MRHLLSTRDLSRDEAVSLMSALAWRGISGFPRRDEPGDS